MYIINIYNLYECLRHPIWLNIKKPGKVYFFLQHIIPKIIYDSQISFKEINPSRFVKISSFTFNPFLQQSYGLFSHNGNNLWDDLELSKTRQIRGVGFYWLHKKRDFLLTTLKVVHILNTHCPIENSNGTLKEAHERFKFENDNYICQGQILSSMAVALFNVYQVVESANAL